MEFSWQYISAVKHECIIPSIETPILHFDHFLQILYWLSGPAMDGILRNINFQYASMKTKFYVTVLESACRTQHLIYIGKNTRPLLQTSAVSLRYIGYPNPLAVQF